MTCTQANIFLSNVKFGAVHCPSRSSYFYPSHLKCQSCKAFPRFVYSQSKHRRFDQLCMATGNSERENRGFSWDYSNRGIGGMGQELSMRDFLREQMHRQVFGENGGDGGHPGGHGGDGSGGQDDQNLHAVMDEVLQVVFATIGFIIVYAYLLSGAELTRLARDYVHYVFGGTASWRLMRTMEMPGEFYASIIRTVDVLKDWLGRAIVATPILLQNPRKLVELLRSGNW